MFRILVSNHTAAVEADGDRRGRLLPTASPGVTLAGAFVVLSFCLVFMRPWWNRYLGLTNEGWFQLFGLRILQGLVPYRDFYLHVPPGQALTMAALISVFGNRIVVGEMFGLIAALTPFFWLYMCGWLASFPHSGRLSPLLAPRLFISIVQPSRWVVCTWRPSCIQF